PFGLVGIEAGCVGLPSVAFDVGGIGDWLEGSVTGEWANPGSLTSRALAGGIVRALSNAEHHQRLREGAWTRAGRFTKENHLDKLEMVFQELETDRSAGSLDY